FLDVSVARPQWRGAAERVLRGFAMSLLVPDTYYTWVSAWVNDRFLEGTKLVYHRVREQGQNAVADPPGDHLLLRDTLEVESGPFAAFINGELSKRADYLCAESLDEFRAANRAVTQQGQIRAGHRHEKDDRYSLDDPSRWVLGWSNEHKVSALTDQLTQAQTRLLAIEDEITRIKAERDRLHQRRTSLQSLAAFENYTDIDWQAAGQQADQAESERAQLLSESSQLGAIEKQLEHNQEAAEQKQHELSQLRVSIAIDRDAATNAAKKRDREHAVVTERHEASDYDVIRQAYVYLDARVGGDPPADPDDCDRIAAELTKVLQQAIVSLRERGDGYQLTISRQMDDIRRRWPEATTEMDASIESASEFRQFRDRVEDDDLPRFADEFKRQLNTNTIRELASFNN